jgi:hypothetical protein
MAQDVTATATPNIFDSAVCFTLSLHTLGDTRKVSPKLITEINSGVGSTDAPIEMQLRFGTPVVVNAAKDFINMNKRLFQCPEYRAITTYHAQIRDYVYRNSVPASFLKSGMYIIKDVDVDRIFAGVDNMILQAQRLYDAFMLVYPAMIDRDRQRLRGVYDLDDYLNERKARASFGVEYQIVEFSAPGRGRRISRERLAEETEKLERTVTNAADAIVQLLLTETSEIVNRAVDRLAGSRADGKPEIFRDSFVPNLKDFFQTLRNRNITDLQAFNDIADRANALLEGVVDSKQVRDIDSLRKSLGDGFREVQTMVEQAIIAQPSRRITFDGD